MYPSEKGADIMNRETMGTVVSSKMQWWLKINTKPVREFATDGAIFPYVIKVSYIVNGKEYTKRKWLNAGEPVPGVGDVIKVTYDEDKPARAKVL